MGSGKKMVKFAEKIKTLRKNAKMTQQQVSDALGVKRSAYAYYEIGSTLPRAENIADIAKLYNITADYLVDDDFDESMASRGYVASPDKYDISKIESSFNELNGFEKEIVSRVRVMSVQGKLDLINFLNSKQK